MGVYRTLAYVKAETESLAEQLKGVVCIDVSNDRL